MDLAHASYSTNGWVDGVESMWSCGHVVHTVAHMNLGDGQLNWNDNIGKQTMTSKISRLCAGDRWTLLSPM